MKLNVDTIVNTTIAVVMGMILFKVLDKLFLDEAISKLGNK